MPSDDAEAPTQQIRRPAAMPGLPAGLDPARSSDTGRVDDSTQVMPLDELMDLAAEPRPAAPTRPHAAPPPLQPPLAYPTDVVPANSGAAPMPSVLLQRIRSDARRASAIGIAQVQQWLETKDNALIAATVLITVVLLVVVAAL